MVSIKKSQKPESLARCGLYLHSTKQFSVKAVGQQEFMTSEHLEADTSCSPVSLIMLFTVSLEN